MIYDMTQRVAEVWKYYDELLDERIARISEASGVPADQMIKINPAEFIEKNRFQNINGYRYQRIEKWIDANKRDDTFLISPMDAIEETAAQISYKSNVEIKRTLRASKCEVIPVPKPLALDFFVRNHRQSAPNVSKNAISFGLVFKNELVAVMLYDIQNGAVRGGNMSYELLRLSISKGTRIHGGASKLQKACEETLRQAGVKQIFSYSNATINSGAVYKVLGFTGSNVTRGQPFVIMDDNSLERLINLYPDSTDDRLAKKGRIMTHVGGNKTWIKNI